MGRPPERDQVRAASAAEIPAAAAPVKSGPVARGRRPAYPCLAQTSQGPQMTSPPAPSPLLRGLMVWTIYAIPVLVSVRPIGDPLYDPDVWWHLRLGQWAVEHHAVAGLDPPSQQSAPADAYGPVNMLPLHAHSPILARRGRSRH